MNSDEEDEEVVQLKHVTLVYLHCYSEIKKKKKVILTERAYYTIPNWIYDAVTCTQ